MSLAAVLLAGLPLAHSQSAPAPAKIVGPALIESAGRTELHVNGVPFFVHAAALPYYRQPADLWDRSLSAYQGLGINTIELRIPWNWHEIRPGEFDFEGRTNPRRDLRRLLRLLAEKEIRLVLRPAAPIAHWLNDGIPQWQLARSEAEREESRAAFARRLMQELSGYTGYSVLTIPDKESRKENATKQVSGPLLMVVAPSPAVAAVLRAADQRTIVTTEAARHTAATTDRRHENASPQLRNAPGAPVPLRFNLQDALAQQEHTSHAAIHSPAPWLPPLSLYSPAPPDDVRPAESSPNEALVRSRWVLANGVAGWSYDAIQDALAPAGFTPAGAPRVLRYDAALDLNAGRLAGAETLLRNGQLMEMWEGFLASSHQRTDFAAVIGDTAPSAAAWQQLSLACLLGDFSLAAIDPARHSVERMLEHPLILWNTQHAALPEKSQSALRAYAEGGGTLIVYPARPGGEAFAAIWQMPESAPGVRNVVSGRVLELASDPFVALPPARSIAEVRAQPEAVRALDLLRHWLRVASSRPLLERVKPTDATLLMAELVSNAGTRPFGERARDSRGLLSIANLTSDTVEEEINVVSPRMNIRTRGDASFRIPVTLPPYESLLLPLHASLCTAPNPKKPCADEVLFAGAELLRAERDGKTLELTFYAPARAAVTLRLAEQPQRARADEMSIDGLWTPATHQFEVPIPRGPAPHYLRVLRVQLPYEPQVKEKPDPEKIGRRDYDLAITDSVRFPLAPDLALETYPPLIVLKPERTGRMVVQARNFDVMGRGIDLKVTGPVKASEELGLDPGELGFERIELKPSDDGNGQPAPSPGLLPAQLEAKSGRDRRNVPLAMLWLEEKKITPYQYDFDRDGALEWALEDKHLRIVASPENGGRIVALVDKESGLSLTTALGLLRDRIVGTTADAPAPLDLEFTPYSAAWVRDGENMALRLDSPPLDGLRLQKTIHVTGDDSFEARYEWEGAATVARTVEASLSVPVTLHGENTTRFCWEKPRDAAPANTVPGSAPEMHCETFEPLGKAIMVPSGVQHLEVRTPGSFALRLEWAAGAMHIEMKNYSALLRFAFPRAAPGGPGHATLKFRAIVVE